MSEAATNSRWLEDVVLEIDKKHIFPLMPHDKPRLREIVQCVNAHDELVQALRLAEEELAFDADYVEYRGEPRQVQQALQLIRAALSRAEDQA